MPQFHHLSPPVCVTDSGHLEQQLEQASSAHKDLEESSKHIKGLEKQVKSMNQEKDDIQKVLECLLLFWFQHFQSRTKNMVAKIWNEVR